MNAEKLFIVIPVHNRRQFTHACLQSLQAQTRADFSVIVVDDSSTDGTRAMIEAEFPATIVLEGDGNLYWTRATNLGVEYALEHDAHSVMTLNNDTVPTPDFIEQMTFAAARNPTALIGALAVDMTTGKPFYGGERIHWASVSATSLLAILPPDRQHGLHEVTHFPGRGLLIPAGVFRTVGLFDAEHFPHYAADYDFTHRTRRAGYQLFCNYDARLGIYPEASGSVHLRRQRTIKNYLDHLWGIKGGGNLRVFTCYAWYNCPKKYRARFMVQGYLERILGYWRQQGT